MRFVGPEFPHLCVKQQSDTAADGVHASRKASPAGRDRLVLGDIEGAKALRRGFIAE